MMNVNDYLEMLYGYKLVSVIDGERILAESIPRVDALSMYGWREVRSLRASRIENGVLILHLVPEDEAGESKSEILFRELGEDAGLNADYEWEFVGDSQTGAGVSQWIYCPRGICFASVEMSEDGTMVSCMYDGDGRLMYDNYVNTFADGVKRCYEYMEELEDAQHGLAMGEPFYSRYGRA